MEDKIDEILLANFKEGDWQTARKQLMDLFAVMHSLPTADDNTYMQIINYGLQWGGKNPLGWKTGQDVVDYAKSKHLLFKGNDA